MSDNEVSLEMYSKFFSQQIEKLEFFRKWTEEHRERLQLGDKDYVAFDKDIYSGIADSKIAIRRIEILMRATVSQGSDQRNERLIPTNEREDLDKIISLAFNKGKKLEKTFNDMRKHFPTEEDKEGSL